MQEDWTSNDSSLQEIIFHIQHHDNWNEKSTLLVG